MRELQQLRTLDMGFNRIQSMDSLMELRHNRSLRELRVQGNESITCHPDYRERIKRMIPQLDKVDGLVVVLHSE